MPEAEYLAVSAASRREGSATTMHCTAEIPYLPRIIDDSGEAELVVQYCRHVLPRQRPSETCPDDYSFWRGAGALGCSKPNNAPDPVTPETQFYRS